MDAKEEVVKPKFQNYYFYSGYCIFAEEKEDVSGSFSVDYDVTPTSAYIAITKKGRDHFADFLKKKGYADISPDEVAVILKRFERIQ
jgi:hypothetical protein